jgi:uncharacterized protein YndB with AHSA1/START domain
MPTQPFTIERILNAPVSKVWNAITNKNEMKNWYFDLAEFKPEPGFEFQFSAGDDKQQFLHLCKVTEVIKEKKLTYSWRYDGYEGNSFVTFELEPQGEKTKLKLTHSGLETFPQSNASFAKENFSAGWTHIIGTALANYIDSKK